MPGPTRDFWDTRFQSGDTPWDRGGPSPQLAAWLADGALKPCRILVPGCGSGYEVLALARAGFEVTGLDYSKAALERVRAMLGGLAVTLAEADALAWNSERAFDAIYEQTCLCALYPDYWREYADQLDRWLKPGGRLFALFVQCARPGAAEGLIQGPPYHCDIHAMRALFPQSRWGWPKPPYARVPHPSGFAELALVLEHKTLST